MRTIEHKLLEPVVIPANAGTPEVLIDPRLRGDDVAWSGNPLGNKRDHTFVPVVIPANAGTPEELMGPRFHGDDDEWIKEPKCLKEN